MGRAELAVLIMMSYHSAVGQRAHDMHKEHKERSHLLAALASPWAALDEVLDGRV